MIKQEASLCDPEALYPALVALLLVAGVFLSGCRQAPRAAAAPPPATALPTVAVVASPSPSPEPLVVGMAAITPTPLPAFSLPTAGPPTTTATAVVTPTVAATAAPLTATAILTETASGVTPTLAPTFTPPAAPETSTNEHYWFRRPVAQGGVVWTDKYYPYGSTRGGQLRPHHGVEFNVTYNTEILAAGPGTIVVAGSDSEVAYGPQTNFYGNLVVIEHDFQINGQPVYTLYGHLNEVLVSPGQRIESQQVIGLSGATGVADGPHTHFEVRVGANSYDQTRNPLLWLYPFPDRGTIAGRVTWPDGTLVEAAPVSLNRIDGSAPYQATTTYAGTTVIPDGSWNENFAIDDVPAGYYEVVVNAGSKKHKAEIWVYPQRTSFVEIVLEP